MTIGFDFGTHQTKICVADYSDKNHPIRRFWKFHTPNGDSYMLPSIVQINNDDTLTYGCTNMSCVKTMVLRTRPKPDEPTEIKPEFVFEEKEPTLVLPPKPKPQKLDWKDKLRALQNGIDTNNNIDWELECGIARRKYERLHREWKAKWIKYTDEYEKKLDKYNKAIQRYQKELNYWESHYGNLTPQPAIFRYFKQASFFNSYKWDYIIDKDYLSVWYLAYILFDLEEEFEQNMTIQIGFPSGARYLEQRKSHAVRLLLSAYHLVEDVFANDKDSFLLTPYQELIEKTEFIDPTPEKKSDYGIIAYPEAYAGLVTATSQGRISNGISLVVDIGGGTTDISLFNLDEKAPHIYGYESMEVGINYLVEQMRGFTDLTKQNSMESLSHEQMEQAKILFNEKLSEQINKIVARIYKAFQDVAYNTGSLTSALKHREIVYSGGGSSYDYLCKAIRSFTSVRKMSKDIWQGFVIEDRDEILPLASVLSTALGLSVPCESETDDVAISDTEAIFSHLPKKKEQEVLIWGRRPEDMYGLADD